MATVKTAISIDKELYRQVEAFAKKLHMSRSQVFAQAVLALVHKKEDLELLTRLNNAYGDEQQEERATVRLTRQLRKKRGDEGW